MIVLGALYVLLAVLPTTVGVPITGGGAVVATVITALVRRHRRTRREWQAVEDAAEARRSSPGADTSGGAPGRTVKIVSERALGLPDTPRSAASPSETPADGDGDPDDEPPR